jgi:UDP-N-acetylmuramoylalanine-D-glutamate ligase
VRIFEFQTESDFAVFNADDFESKKYFNRTKATKVFFSQYQELEEGIFPTDSESISMSPVDNSCSTRPGYWRSMLVASRGPLSCVAHGRTVVEGMHGIIMSGTGRPQVSEDRQRA